MAKRIKVAIGDLFLLPRTDGRWVLGQVLEEWMKGVICVAILDHVVSNKGEPITLGALPPPAFSLPSVAKGEITRGNWPIVGKSGPLVDVHLAPHYQFVTQRFNGASWHSGKMIERLVDAYYGLGTWEPYPGRPGHLRSLLLSQSDQGGQSRVELH